MRHKPQHPWYRKKNYLHFDLALNLKQAEAYVSNPDNILSHRFSPLIHYKKLSAKVKRNKEAEQKYKASGKTIKKPKLQKKTKKRNIFYSSHIDGYIYSFYAKLLEEKYEQFLKAKDLESNVIAYRGIEKNGEKFSNINFASEVFENIRSRTTARILCFDLSKFFDNLSPKVLKENWALILGIQLLPPDHYRVFRSVTNFSYVDEGALIQNFSDRFEVNPRKHGFKARADGSNKRRICDYPELRALHQSCDKNLIKHQSALNIGGVAQGTAISGILSNIFMIKFDLAMKNKIEANGGCYRRYSDDIFICVENLDFPDVVTIVEDVLAETGANSVQLNSDKTELRTFEYHSGRGLVKDLSGDPSKVQYLGFHFDGEDVHIRTSSMSKDRGKIIQTIRKHKDTISGIDTKAVYKKRSPRVISKYDNPKKKGFTYYATRAQKIHDDSKSIGKQFLRKTDKFIAASIKREKEMDAKKREKKELAKQKKQLIALEKRAKKKSKKPA